jgi:hypothetical protein
MRGTPMIERTFMQADTAQTTLEASTTRGTGYARLAVGLLQGALLYLLYMASKDKAWPATDPYLFMPLLMGGVLLPVLLISSLGHLAGRKVAAWLACAALVVVVLAVHDTWRSAGTHLIGPEYAGRFPSPALALFTAAFFFIAHALVMAGVQEGRRLASYAAYFETAWKLCIQCLFSLLFVGVLWLTLWLGSGLFMLVKLHFLKELLQQPWFGVPVTCFAFACAMHITDVRPAIVRGIRTLLLVLLSWLLPVTVLILGGFLCMLPFTGLDALWKTGHAASLLLAADALLIVLINAAYQNGEVEQTVARAVRLSARVAAMLLLPVTAIAVYALYLRVGEYGWSADRITAAACLLVASCYALGYLLAARQQGAWLRTLSMTNVGAAWLVLAVLLALFTPIADPARISVNSQLARLERGVVKAADFDYGYLRFEGARYGRAALERMKTASSGPEAAAIRAGATEALAKDYRRMAPYIKAGGDIAANLTVWPKGARLPESFPLSGWKPVESAGAYAPLCLTRPGRACDAFVLDLTGDGKPEVMLVGAERENGSAVLTETDGKWTFLGHLPYDAPGCVPLLEKLRAGHFEAVLPPMRDLQVGGSRIPIREYDIMPKPICR